MFFTTPQQGKKTGDTDNAAYENKMFIHDLSCLFDASSHEAFFCFVSMNLYVIAVHDVVRLLPPLAVVILMFFIFTIPNMVYNVTTLTLQFKFKKI